MDVGRRGALILAATSLGFGVVQLDVTVVNVAIESIGASLGGGVSSLQWVVNAYTLAFAALILSAGALGDRIGARRVYVAGLTLFTAASALCGLAPSTGALIAARAVQGVGAAICVPSSLSLLSHAFSDDDARTRAIGFWTAGASAALSAGPLVGGVLIAGVGWRAIFFINVPLGLIAIALTLRNAPETTRTAARGLDLRGQLAAVVALGAMAAATIEGGSRGFGSAAVLAGYALALAAFATFLAVERRGASPMLPLGLFRRPAFATASTIGLLVNVVFYGLIFVFSLLFQAHQGLSPLQTGLALAPATVAIVAANLVTGRLAARIGSANTIALGATVMALSCCAMLGVDDGTSAVVIAVPVATLGLGLGTLVPVMTAVLLGSVERPRSGVASGTLNTMRQTGSVVGVALFGSLTAGGFVAGLHVALVLSALLALTAAALTRRIAA